jgi:CO/xanthine dehydrogenase FAD-binding subunit
MGIEMKPYYRPLSLESYGYLLKKAGEKARVLAGGGYLPEAAEARKGDVLIDLQALKLDQVKYEGEAVHIGGLCNLNMLMFACSGLPDLGVAIKHQAGSNVRNTLSLANFLRSGRIGQSSPLLCALLALDARIQPIFESNPSALADYFLKEIPIPIAAELILPKVVDFHFGQVGRSEMDLPQVCMGLIPKKDQELRVAIDAEKLLVFEGNREAVIKSITEQGLQLGDQWAGGAYRQKTLLVLLDRLIGDVQERKETK